MKERELPEPDDEFAQLASEFDTIDELKNSLVEQVNRVKRVQQAEQIRDKALETLLEQVEVPLPENVVQAQVDETLHNAIHGLDHDEARFAEALAEQGSSREKFDEENRTNAEKAVKTQLLVDAIADKLDVQVGQNDLTERLVLMSQHYGLEPQQLLATLQQNNQLPAMFADVRRGLTVAQSWRRHRHRHRRRRDRHQGVLRHRPGEQPSDRDAEASRRRRSRSRRGICRRQVTL